MYYVKNPILTTKVRNAVKKNLGDDIVFKLRNININGSKRGCSGFITNPMNGVTVYINSEPCSDMRIYYRFAKDDKDCTGCRNRLADDFDSFIGGICKCLNSPEKYQRELVSFGKAV